MPLTPEELHRYVDVLRWALPTARGQAFEPGDLVLVRFEQRALPLAEMLHDRLVRDGLHVVTRLRPTSAMDRSFHRWGTDAQLDFIPPGEPELLRSLNGLVAVEAPASLHHLAGIDPARLTRPVMARKPLRDILNERERQGLFGWTLCALPTPAAARAARIGLAAATDQVRRACFLDHPDPVAEWRRVHESANRIKAWLNAMPARAYRVEGEGLDLTVPRGDCRRWVGVSGHNIPSFELYLSPDWRGVEGRYGTDQPVYRGGQVIDGIRLEFSAGEVVRAAARRGQRFLETQLGMDPGARRLGEFSLTDRRFSRIDQFMANTLYDENFGGLHGNCHIALGAAYDDAYNGPAEELTTRRKADLGFNDSALHWDLVNTAPKTVTALLADGTRTVIYADGCFRLPA